MSSEKIKIYVTKKINDTICQDAENFEFWKTNSFETNKNAFLTALIVNYIDEFKEKQLNNHETIFNILKNETSLSDNKIDQICYKISEKFNREIFLSGQEKFENVLSLKPTKISEPVIDYIEKYLLKNQTLSEYFRNMFTNYCLLPQDKREIVIFKNNYQLLQNAIENRKRVFVTTKTKTMTKIEISPFSFARSKEELHTFLLATNSGTCIPLRLSRILSVNILEQKSDFNNQQVQVFEKMKFYGPQFFYSFNEEETIVELTDKGKELFKKIYVHRPNPKKVDGNIFTFDCSQDQVVMYFKRFGSDAFIISPKNKQNSMIKFYKNAYKSFIAKSQLKN